jgi:hypothetical protein
MIRSFRLLQGFGSFLCIKLEKIYKIIVFFNIKFYLLYDFKDLKYL